MQPGGLPCFKFRLFSELSSEQLSAEFRILPHSFAPFLNVKDLCINAVRLSSQGASHGDQWSWLLDSFKGVKWLHLDGNESIIIEHALQRYVSNDWRGVTVEPVELCTIPSYLNYIFYIRRGFTNPCEFIISCFGLD
jgi:hypothetical protein